MRRLSTVGLFATMVVLSSCKQRANPSTGLTTQDAAQGESDAMLKARIKGQLQAIQTNVVNMDRSRLSEKAQLGLDNVLTGQAIAFPIPMMIYRFVRGKQAAETQWLTEGALLNPVQQDRAKTVSIGLGEAVYTENGVELVTRTCFQCHAGTVAGQTVLGLTHNHFDPVPLIDFLESALKYADPSAAVLDSLFPLNTINLEWVEKAKTYMNDFSWYAREFFMPPLKFATTRGDNLGAFSVWYMAAKFKDPKKHGILVARGRVPSDLEKLVTGQKTLPIIDSMPWWLMKFKDRAYWFWDAPYHTPAAFNLNFYTPVAAVDRITSDGVSREHVKKFEDKVHVIDSVLQFARETEPPTLPTEARQKLVANWVAVERGSALFHDNKDSTGKLLNSTGKPLDCASCHGSYKFTDDGIEVDYPDTGLEDVGTDPAYNKVLQLFSGAAKAINAARPFYNDRYGPISYHVDVPGYTSSPLVGVWATAPYLHNGSVPTLAALFESHRPAIWGRPIYTPNAYDVDREIGILYDKIDRPLYTKKIEAANKVKVTDPQAYEARRFYDTIAYGRGNYGHEYGVSLNPREKADIIAFMMALSPLPEKGIKKIYSKKNRLIWANGNFNDESDPDMSHKEYKVYPFNKKVSERHKYN